MVCVAAGAEQTASLKMRFVLDGQPPPVKNVRVVPGIAPIIDEQLLVDPKSRGIKNILVYVKPGRGGPAIEPPPAQVQKRTLAMTNARFDPRFVILRSGDTLEVVERGPAQHVPVFNFVKNKPQGLILPVGGKHQLELTKAEPAPVPIDGRFHPWMRAYVLVLDHPFAAVSDSDGKLVLEGLPANTLLTFRAFHEAGTIDRASVAGDEQEWRRCCFQITLNEGENDLGDVLVDPDLFRL